MKTTTAVPEPVNTNNTNGIISGDDEEDYDDSSSSNDTAPSTSYNERSGGDHYDNGGRGGCLGGVATSATVADLFPRRKQVKPQRRAESVGGRPTALATTNGVNTDEPKSGSGRRFLVKSQLLWKSMLN